MGGSPEDCGDTPCSVRLTVRFRAWSVHFRAEGCSFLCMRNPDDELGYGGGPLTRSFAIAQVPCGSPQRILACNRGQLNPIRRAFRFDARSDKRIGAVVRREVVLILWMRK